MQNTLALSIKINNIHRIIILLLLLLIIIIKIIITINKIQ